jgi:hypothetical protein
VGGSGQGVGDLPPSRRVDDNVRVTDRSPSTKLPEHRRDVDFCNPRLDEQSTTWYVLREA